jgi:peptidoglycan/xylan/chitin deacetylase (PgdA/CDA1 family)
MIEECRFSDLKTQSSLKAIFQPRIPNLQSRIFNSKIPTSAIPFTIPSMLGPVIAGAGVVIAVWAGYQSMSPTGQWYGRTFKGISAELKQLALTYDDGPNDPHTLRLLEVLAKHEVRATFFMIGRYVRQRPDIVREVSRAGHVIGNHTFSHPLLTLKSVGGIKKELTDCEHALHDAIGGHSNLFRPPFGARRPAVLRIASGLGLIPVMWNVTGYDWDAQSAENIERKIVRRVGGGSVILLHDGGHKEFGADRSGTVEASDRLISKYKSEGYEFVTVLEMMSRSNE